MNPKVALPGGCGIWQTNGRPGGTTCPKSTIPPTTSTGPRRSHQHSGHFPTSSSWRSACAGQGGSPTWTGFPPPAGSSGRESRSGAPSEEAQKSKTQGAEHPCSRAPVFGVAGGLNPAARVTAEAEMDLPSPPLSTSDSGHPQMQKSRKKLVLQQIHGAIQQAHRRANWNTFTSPSGPSRSPPPQLRS